jgi:alkane 1-monooxygenase
MPISAVIPLLLLSIVPLAYGAGTASSWLSVPVLFVGFAGLEHALGPDRDRIAAAPSTLAYRLPIWAYIVAQLSVILWGIATASHIAMVGRLLGLAVSTGTAAGVFGMLAAHEMIHSRRRGERVLGLAMLAGVSYPHFRISHVYGHHRRAATRDDPATARQGESAYRFVLRSTAGQLGEAWRHERRRCHAKAWPLAANRVHRYLALALALYAGIALLFGVRGVAFELVQSVIAIAILELFNYVAHYGLVRQRAADGRIEPLGTKHSWNVACRVDNALLFNGGRHTHHHREPALHWHRLRLAAKTPLLPFGLAGSILIALIPPLWRRIMDPKVDYWMASPAPGKRSPRSTPRTPTGPTLSVPREPVVTRSSRQLQT